MGGKRRRAAAEEIFMPGHVDTVADDAASAPRLIDAKIAALGGWRGEALARLRALIHEADAEVIETVKWRKPSNPTGVPVWEHDGIVCAGDAFKDKVKLTFAHGAALDDPTGVFNAGLDGGKWRAIDLHEREAVDGEAFKAVIRAAVALNVAKASKPPRAPAKAAAARADGRKGGRTAG